MGAEELVLGRCETEFASKWLAALLPVLDKFVEAYSGEVDDVFWISMAKRGGTSGSGARTWFNGWMNILFPYIDGHPNHYMEPYSTEAGYVKEGLVYDQRYGMCEPAGVAGPDCEDFPNGLSEAPVLWEYFGSEMPLKFKAGFLGASQDPKSLTISP